ncbi:MAG: hypothetical protein AB2777_17540 [Candidatus Thiodiazotropha endolucinida]
MKKIPIQKTQNFSFSVEFSGRDLVALEKIGANAKSLNNYLTCLACIAANIKSAKNHLHAEKNRNRTIDIVRRAVNDLRQAQAWLYTDEYPTQLIDDLTLWSDSLRLSVAKQIADDDRIELVSSDGMAVGAVSVLLSGIGVEISTNYHKTDIGPFLSVAVILFRAAGIEKSPGALEKAYRRFEKKWGKWKIYEDARYLCHPSFSGYRENIEINYSIGDSFTANFRYHPRNT